MSKPTINKIEDLSSISLMYALVVRAFENLKDHKVKDCKKSMRPEHFRKEFGIVKLYLPRQFGHTEVATQLMMTYDKSVLFVTNGPSRQEVERRVMEHWATPLASGKSKLLEERMNEIRHNIFLKGDDVTFERHRRSGMVNPDNTNLVILERASDFTYLEKEGILSVFPNAKLIVELQ